MRPVVVCVVGTRPEAIKMAPLILRLRRRGSELETRVVTSGQHRGLLDRALDDFGLTPDTDLDLMQPDQGLAELTARALVGLAEYLRRAGPSFLLAQGDTSTVLSTALACHYNRVPFGHVEAGLRSGRADDPFPEEKNRVLTSHLAEMHFAPTPAARRHLLDEGIAAPAIHVTGNTVIDALRWMADREPPLPVAVATGRFLLVTAHRRENFGAPLERICGAVVDLVARHPDLSVVIPVHPNPRVRSVVLSRLGGHDRIHLIEPVGYPAFVALMKASCLILTDSGGVQEEGPTLGKPVLVLRETTERPEAVAAGTARLVGTGRREVVAAVERILEDAGPRPPWNLPPASNPYGDGWASERIARLVEGRLGLVPLPPPPGFDPDWPVADHVGSGKRGVRVPHFRVPVVT